MVFCDNKMGKVYTGEVFLGRVPSRVYLISPQGTSGVRDTSSPSFLVFKAGLTSNK